MKGEVDVRAAYEGSLGQEAGESWFIGSSLKWIPSWFGGLMLRRSSKGAHPILFEAKTSVFSPELTRALWLFLLIVNAGCNADTVNSVRLVAFWTGAIIGGALGLSIGIRLFRHASDSMTTYAFGIVGLLIFGLTAGIIMVLGGVTGLLFEAVAGLLTSLS